MASRRTSLPRQGEGQQDCSGIAAVLACRRRAWLSERTTLSILLVVFALVLTYTDWLWRWDQVFYDCSLRSWYRAPAQDIVIVAIDERSLRELGRWPWSRRVHAELVDKLNTAGAKVVALNIVFAEPAALDPSADVVLAAAIERSSRVAVIHTPGCGRGARERPARRSAMAASM